MTQPKEKGGVPPIEIYTIIGKGVDETDPVKKQDDENEDAEFKRIEDEQFRQKELEKVRNLTRWP
jgi:hypothetical protein